MSKINELIQTLCPDGVEYKKLGDVCSICTDYTAAGSFAAIAKNVQYLSEENYALLVRTMDIKSKFSKGNSIYVDKHAFEYLWRVQLSVDSIILPNIGNCGEVYYLKPQDIPYKNAVLAPNAILLRSENCNMRFLYYILQSSAFQWALHRITTPGGQTKFNKTDLKKLEIPVPPLPVQDEIVRILDEYTDLEAELEAKLSEEIKLKQKQYMFLTSELIDKLESDSVVPLESVCGVYDGTHSTPQYTDSGVRFVSVENINDLYGSKKFISEEAYEKFKIKPQIGDVFMTRIGTMGKCAIVDRDEPLGYYVSLALLRPDSTVLSSEYLRWYLESGAGWKELEARTLWNATPIKINKGEIGKMLIKVPSLAVQDVVVKKIKAYYDAKTSLLTLLNTELESRKKQYAYYRDQLLTFKRKEV